MKKLFFAALAVAMMSLSLISCDKDDPAEGLNVNTNRTAEFKGKVLINTSNVSSEPTWSAPGDLKISAKVKYSELGFSFAGADSKYYTIPAANISYNASAGEYTVKSPVGLNGSSIEIAVDNFAGRVTIAAEKTVDVIWNGFTINSTKGYEGSVIYLDDKKLNGTGYSIVTNPGDKI